MLHYYKFRQDLFDPQPAQDVYVKRGPGRGWPEHCPPLRSANAFGFDLLANFDLMFVRQRGGWRVLKDRVVKSDFNFSASDESPGAPLRQQYAWFWERGQKIPHVITDNVYAEIRNQVKVSSFLFLRTDPNELLMMTDIPNLRRKFRVISAVVETDWYPASYPWHIVLDLDDSHARINIHKGEPICRVVPIRRDAYFASPMTPREFDEFYARGQRWLGEHGKAQHEGVVDITGTYVRQQAKSKFIVLD